VEKDIIKVSEKSRILLNFISMFLSFPGFSSGHSSGPHFDKREKISEVFMVENGEARNRGESVHWRKNFLRNKKLFPFQDS